MDEEQRQRGGQGEQFLATTKELEKARAQIRGLEEELTRSREYTTIMANMGQNRAGCSGQYTKRTSRIGSDTEG